jgi:hypothetical protein
MGLSRCLVTSAINHHSCSTEAAPLARSMAQRHDSSLALSTAAAEGKGWGPHLMCATLTALVTTSLAPPASQPALGAKLSSSSYRQHPHLTSTGTAPVAAVSVTHPHTHLPRSQPPPCPPPPWCLHPSLGPGGRSVGSACWLAYPRTHGLSANGQAATEAGYLCS